MSKTKQTHVPVLLHEVLDYLAPQAGKSFLDLTAGLGGHAGAVIELTTAPGRTTLIDRDPEAVRVLRKKFVDVEILQSDFRSALEKLARQGKRYDIILADLGVSSLHLDSGLRGFSFLRSGPLDMRLDANQALTAEKIVNTWSETDLADILKGYGEEKKSRAIAKNIVLNRPVHTTGQLADIVAKSYRFRSKIHPATKTFQALRIAVNDELKQLAHSLPLILEVLAPGGRLAVISFHSLEDRLVKNFLAENSGTLDAQLQILTKKPITASASEIVSNPRARSAKLRAAVKIKTRPL